MTIYIFLDDGTRLTPSNIEPVGSATKTGFRPLSAGFDGLLRSGTTLIAAERTGLSHYGPECDRAQLDAIIRRRKALTGGRPRQAASGYSFDDLAREAEAANAP
jgi:hypothetical protein